QSPARRNPAGHVECPLPLLHPRPNDPRHRSSGKGDVAMKFTKQAQSALTRRGFLKTSGALVVGFSLSARDAAAQGPLAGSPSANQLDSWIAIAADRPITAYSGKQATGQGISIAQQQLVAEELSVPLNRVNLIYCDTAFTPD